MSRTRLAIFGFLVVLVGALLFLTVERRRPGPDAASAGADVPSSPKFKPSKEAMLKEDFSDSGLDGWKPDREGVWSVVDGMLRARLPDEKQEKSFLRAGDAGWTDYAVDVDVCMTRGVDKGVAVHAGEKAGVGIDLRGPGYDDVLLHRGMKQLGKASVGNANGRWHHIRLESDGPHYRVFVNGKRVIEATDDSDEAKSGGIALAAYTGGSAMCTVYYDNVVVTPLTAARPKGQED